MPFNFNWNAVSGGAPYVTVSAISIALNSASIDKLGNPKQVVVGFDEEQRAIGIKAYTDEANVKPYDFADRVKNGWVRIGCRDFVKYLSALTGIKFTPAKKYVAQYDANDKLLYILVSGESETEISLNEE